MHRRLLGLLLLVAALGTVALSSGSITRIPGVGGPAVHVTGPPSVGDCVYDDPAPRGLAFGTVAPVSSGACDRPHRGEVVSLYASMDAVPTTGMGSRAVPDVTTCRPAANSYLGVDQVTPRTDRGDFSSHSFGPWLPVGTGSLALVGPDDLQRTLGQRWVACVSYGPGPAFRESVRNAFTGGALPDAYGVCTQLDVDFPQRAVPCGTPHQVEVFATTGLIYRIEEPDGLLRQCTQLISEDTRLADVTAGGRLAVRSQMTHFDAEGKPLLGYPTQENQEPAQATCALAVVGRGRLTATLFGLGSSPLPLAG